MSDLIGSDLISRQAAIDAVGNMLRRKFGIGGDLANITLSELPSADAVQTVRCKDCKHSKRDDFCKCRWCQKPGSIRVVKDEFFCAYGEREDNGMDS